MKSFLDKAKSHLQTSRNPSSSPVTSSVKPPTPQDIFRYRSHHGTNLGSIFVLEQWLFPSLFPSPPHGSSELDAVTTSFQTLGLAATKSKWEAHWDNALTDEDFTFLVSEARCTSIRLPVGYFTLGEEWCHDSPFEHVGAVYSHAWDAVCTLEKRARKRGIGILLDFHALYGGANSESHSGTSSGVAALWGNHSNLRRNKDALIHIAKQIKHRGMEGVIGLQLCNEAVYGAKGMYEWYSEVIHAISVENPHLPIYISDGWDMSHAVSWITSLQDKQQFTNPIIIDTHKYYCFSAADQALSPQQIIDLIPKELHELDNTNSKTKPQLIIGEYSSVLSQETWFRLPTSEDRPSLVKKFTQAQTTHWQHAAGVGGSYFWTLKMEWPPGGEWGFIEQIKLGNISIPIHLTFSASTIQERVQGASEKEADLARDALESHSKYWDRESPHGKFEHQLYGQGWGLGWSDAATFFKMRVDNTGAKEGGDKIGLLETWVQKRMRESGVRGDCVWEWEHGFRAGVKAFEECVGI